MGMSRDEHFLDGVAAAGGALSGCGGRMGLRRPSLDDQYPISSLTDRLDRPSSCDWRTLAWRRRPHSVWYQPLSLRSDALLDRPFQLKSRPTCSATAWHCSNASVSGVMFVREALRFGCAGSS